ncbi:MAG: polysaccharide biosynthesis tyrosine autokinase [Chloroflexota bacterium]
MQDIPQTIDFKLYTDLLRRWAWLVLALGLLFGIVAYLVSSVATPTYYASSTLLIDNAQSGGITPTGQSRYTELLYTQRMAQTYATLMMGAKIRGQVANEVGLDSAAFGNHIEEISVYPVEDTQLLIVEVTGFTPEYVSSVANTLPEVFIVEIQSMALQRFADSKTSLQEQLDKLEVKIDDLESEIGALGEPTTPQMELERTKLQTTLSQYQNNYVDILGQFETIRLAEAQAASNIFVTDPASVPTTPVGPPVMMNTFMGFAIGAGLALLFISLLGYLDNSIGTPDKLRRRFNQPVLGSIPVFSLLPSNKSGASDSNLVTVKRPRTQVSEAYRILRTGILSSVRTENIKTIAVTSSTSEEGKSTTAANLAVVMAQSGMSVALIDADMRRPTQHQLFSITLRPGLADTLGATGEVQLRYEKHPLLPNLAITPAGTIPMNPSELIGSQKMYQLIDNLSKKVDIIIFDTPPLLSVADTQIISGSVDSVLMVVDAETEPSLVAKGLDALQMTNTNLLGLVLNRSEESNSKQSGSFGYYAQGPVPVQSTSVHQPSVLQEQESSASKDFDITKPVETELYKNGVKTIPSRTA